MTRSYDPSGPYEFPDSYEDEPPQAPCSPPPSRPMTEARYWELLRHWGAVARQAKLVGERADAALTNARKAP